MPRKIPDSSESNDLRPPPLSGHSYVVRTDTGRSERIDVNVGFHEGSVLLLSWTSVVYLCFLNIHILCAGGD